MSASAPPARPAASTQPAQLRVLVLILTLDEAENLPLLLERIEAALPAADILVIDDNSPDGTGRLAEQAAAEDPRLQVRIRRDQRGLGSALREGIAYAIEQEYDFLLNLDADLSHNPADLPRLLATAQADTVPPIDVVIGSRYVAQGGVEGWPLRRRMMSRLVNGFATAILRLPVHDCSGSLRCYRVARLRQVPLSGLRSGGYAMLEELLVRLRAEGASMVEIPITFVDRRQGESKLTSREAVRSAWQLVRMAWR